MEGSLVLGSAVFVVVSLMVDKFGSRLRFFVEDASFSFFVATKYLVLEVVIQGHWLFVEIIFGPFLSGRYIRLFHRSLFLVIFKLRIAHLTVDWIFPRSLFALHLFQVIVKPFHDTFDKPIQLRRIDIFFINLRDPLLVENA